MSIETLAGIVIYSPALETALAFYRDQLGLPLVAAAHGPVKRHHEGLIGQTHVALWPGPARIVPVFRVSQLSATLALCEERGMRRSFGPIALGEGKVVSGLCAPDGEEVRLIEIG